jgi:tetratricopeptide (TPR) repeat protein
MSVARRTISLSLCFCLVLTAPVAAWAAPGAASAKTQLAAAKQAWTRGARFYAQKAYDQALEHFSAGYKLSQKAGFLFNMAECHKQLGAKDKARALFDRYLKKGGKKYRDQALAACKTLGFPGCRDEPRESPVKGLAPAKQAAAAKKTTAKEPTSSPVEKMSERTIATGAKAPPKKTLSPTDFRPLPKKTSRPFYKHWGFWVGIGAAVAAGTATAVALAVSGGGSESKADFTFEPPAP